MQLRISSLIGVVLGVGLGVLGILALGRHRGRAPTTAERRALLPEADGALGHVLLHWTPQADRSLAEPYADFLRAIDASVNITFVVPRAMRDSERQLLEQRLVSIDPTRRLLARVELVEVKGPITAWSKDRALVSQQESASGRARLTIPAEPTDSWQERHNDWQSVADVVNHFPDRFVLDQSPFDFDAGDLAVGRGQLIIDSNLLEKNRRRGYANMAQLAGRLGEYLRIPVITLGQSFGDTPRHHLSMYMTPLTRNQVMVGDPLAAAAILGQNWQPGERGIESQEPLVADFSPATVARFDLAKKELAAHGFEVMRIVNVPFDDKTYLAYTNGVFEVRNGRHIAYVPAYDVPELDRVAHDTYRNMGWEVVPIRVRTLFPYHGTIGCVVNVLQRR